MDDHTLYLFWLPIVGLFLLGIDFNCKPKVSLAVIPIVLLLALLALGIYSIGEKHDNPSTHKEERNVTTK